uniref:Uncharacterized protein n=1 Tax=Zea mays TaxID=4577 RepID=B4FJE1_MAIZE|nr:unknown [Zea mays]
MLLFARPVQSSLTVLHSCLAIIACQPVALIRFLLSSVDNLFIY